MTLRAGRGGWGILRWAYIVTGVFYPLWHLAAPPGATDPWVWWWVISAYLVGVGLLGSWSSFVYAQLSRLLLAGSYLVTLHFFWLAAANEMHPLYAVCSVMAVMVTAGFVIQTPLRLAFYAGFVALLSGVLFAVAPDRYKPLYWGALILIWPFYHAWLGARAKAARLLQQHQKELEQLVAERTRELAASNDQLRAEIAQRQAAEEKLLLAQKMEAIGRLAGGVTHDYNNLLTVILGTVELMKGGLSGNDQLSDDLDQIERAADRARELTRRLLAFSSGSPDEIEHLDLSQTVEDFLPVVKATLGEDIELMVRSASEAPRIRANRNQIEQVLLNLVANARDAMPTGGQLLIETMIVEEGDSDIPVSSEEGLACLIVADSGMGMDAKTRTRAFDPFFTTKDVGKGSGLGLSIVYSIVQSSGGHIRLSTAPGEGSRFELFWPLTAQPAEEKKPSWDAWESTRGNERILLVEDEGEVRRMTRRILEGAGYDVVEATDGEVAKRVVEGDSDGFDLVLTDVVMPKMNGIQLASYLDESPQTVRIMLMSGQLDHPSIRRGELDSQLPLLAKPFLPSELLSRVREVLDK